MFLPSMLAGSTVEQAMCSTVFLATVDAFGVIRRIPLGFLGV